MLLCVFLRKVPNYQHILSVYVLCYKLIIRLWGMSLCGSVVQDLCHAKHLLYHWATPPAFQVLWYKMRQKSMLTTIWLNTAWINGEGLAGWVRKKTCLFLKLRVCLCHCLGMRACKNDSDLPPLECQGLHYRPRMPPWPHFQGLLGESNLGLLGM